MLVYAHPLVKVIKAREFLQGIGKDPWFILIQSGGQGTSPHQTLEKGGMWQRWETWQLPMGICNKFPPGVAEPNLDAFCYPTVINLADFKGGMEMLTLSWCWQIYHPSIPHFITSQECCPESWFIWTHQLMKDNCRSYMLHFHQWIIVMRN